MRVVAAEPCRAFAAALFLALGADEDIAGEVAAHLVHANLSGHDSHGVIRIIQYVKEVDRGDLDPGARPALLKETASTALLDARRGFGQYSTRVALDWALERAAQQGIAGVAVRHSTHIGRLGEYTERAAARGTIAIVTAGAAGPGIGSVTPYGGARRFFGTNPWSLGAPGISRPMIFDGATSVVAEGKVRVAHAKGGELPPGCLVDREGRPTRSPGDFYEGGALLPLGGEVAGHKGYGLAFAAALIGGLSMVDDPAPTRVGVPASGGDDARGRIGGVFLLAIDPGAFGERRAYRAMVEATLSAARDAPPVPGTPRVLIPGEPEAMSRERRAETGIAVPDATWNELGALAERFRLRMPDARPG